MVKNIFKFKTKYSIFFLPFLISSCGMDAGLLDSNSDLSKRQSSEISKKLDELDRSLLLDDTSVDWYGNFCDSINKFSTELDNGDKDQQSRDAVFVQNRIMELFRNNSQLSKDIANKIANYRLPKTNTKNWSDIANKLKDTFNNVAKSADQELQNIASVAPQNVSQLESVISEALNNWKNKVDNISNVIQGSSFPFQNKRTADTAQNLRQCKSLTDDKTSDGKSAKSSTKKQND